MQSVHLICLFLGLLLIFCITFFIILGYLLLILLLFLFIFLHCILVVFSLFYLLVIHFHGLCVLSQMVFSHELHHVHFVVVCDFLFVSNFYFAVVVRFDWLERLGWPLIGMHWVAVVTLVRRLAKLVLLTLLVILVETKEEKKKEKQQIPYYGYSTRYIEFYCNIHLVIFSLLYE